MFNTIADKSLYYCNKVRDANIYFSNQVFLSVVLQTFFVITKYKLNVILSKYYSYEKYMTFSHINYRLNHSAIGKHIGL